MSSLLDMIPVEILHWHIFARCPLKARCLCKDYKQVIKDTPSILWELGSVPFKKGGHLTLLNWAIQGDYGELFELVQFFPGVNFAEHHGTSIDVAITDRRDSCLGAFMARSDFGALSLSKHQKRWTTLLLKRLDYDLFKRFFDASAWTVDSRFMDSIFRNPNFSTQPEFAHCVIKLLVFSDRRREDTVFHINNIRLNYETLEMLLDVPGFKWDTVNATSLILQGTEETVSKLIAHPRFAGLPVLIDQREHKLGVVTPSARALWRYATIARVDITKIRDLLLTLSPAVLWEVVLPEMVNITECNDVAKNVLMDDTMRHHIGNNRSRYMSWSSEDTLRRMFDWLTNTLSVQEATGIIGHIFNDEGLKFFIDAFYCRSTYVPYVRFIWQQFPQTRNRLDIFRHLLSFPANSLADRLPEWFRQLKMLHEDILLLSMRDESIPESLFRQAMDAGAYSTLFAPDIHPITLDRHFLVPSMCVRRVFEVVRASKLSKQRIDEYIQHHQRNNGYYSDDSDEDEETDPIKRASILVNAILNCVRGGATSLPSTF
jgi:hypothetical protein